MRLCQPICKRQEDVKLSVILNVKQERRKFTNYLILKEESESLVRDKASREATNWYNNNNTPPSATIVREFVENS